MALASRRKSCWAALARRLRACLKEELCPSLHGFDPESPERDLAKYEAFQRLLGNVMFVSTLILGFVITVGMLSLSMTGEENYSVKQLLPFLQFSLLATVSSLLSLMMAFRIAQSMTASLQQSVASALRTLRRSALGLAVSELLLYGSLLFFLASIPEFLFLQDLGPRICPTAADMPCGDHCTYTDISNADVHESALCSKLGEAFFHATRKHCLSAQRNVTRTLCNFYDLYVEGNPPDFTDKQSQAAWFAWDKSSIMIMDLASGESAVMDYWQTITSQAIGLDCGSDQATALDKADCAGPLRAGVGLQACLDAKSNVHSVKQCSGRQGDAAAKCRKVCSWVYIKDPNRWGVSPSFVIHNMCRHYIWTCFALVTAIVAIRMVCPLVEGFLVLVDEVRLCTRCQPPVADESDESDAEGASEGSGAGAYEA